MTCDELVLESLRMYDEGRSGRQAELPTEVSGDMV